MYCIYRTTNLINEKTYIGQHKYKSLNDDYMGSGVLIRKAIEKYGKENFSKEIIISGDFAKEQLDKFEKCMIFCERINGKAEYNLADGGGGPVGCIPWNKGLKNPYPEETLEKMSKAQKGKLLSEEHKRNISKNNACYWKGKSFSEEYRKKLSEARMGVEPYNKGMKMSKEQKRKISNTLIGHTPWNKGTKGLQHHSDEYKKNLSESKKIVQSKKAEYYKDYKLNGGTLKWNEFQKVYKELGYGWQD